MTLRSHLFPLFLRMAGAFHGTGIGRLPGIERLYSKGYRWLKGGQPVEITTRHGTRMLVNPADEGVAAGLLVGREVEGHESTLFQSLVQPGMTVLDVGANIGYYTLLAAKLVGEQGHVYAFEPDRTNFELLRRNVDLNGYSNVTPVRAAISDRTGAQRFFVDRQNWGGHSLTADNIPEAGQALEVETTTLDDFFDAHAPAGRVDFIKMDIQGAERLALLGAERLLRRSDVTLMMEFWPFGLRNMGTDPESLAALVRSYGFTIQEIDERSGAVAPASIPAIIRRCEQIHGGRGFTNLLLHKHHE